MELYVHAQKPFHAFILVQKFCYRQGWKKTKIVNCRELYGSLDTSLMYFSATLSSVRVFPMLKKIWCWVCGTGSQAVHHISAASCSSDAMACRCVVEAFQPTFSTCSTQPVGSFSWSIMSLHLSGLSCEHLACREIV